MESSASIRTGEPSSPLTSAKNQFSKDEITSIALVIIWGLGSLIVSGIGWYGYFHGALSPINSIIMMVTGGVSGIIFLSVWVVSCVKRHQANKLQQISNEQIDSSQPEIKPDPARKVKNVSTIDTQGGLFYGAEAWKIWNVEILDVVPEPPKVDLSMKDKIILYIPQRVRVDDQKIELTLRNFIEISGGPFKYFNKAIEEQFGDSIAPGWVVIIPPQGHKKDYKTQQKILTEKGCRLLSTLEATVLNFMAYAHRDEYLYGQRPLIYNRCSEMIDGAPVVVGGFGPEGLSVSSGTTVYYDSTCCVAAGALLEL